VTAEFLQVTVTRYQETETIQAAVITCLWYPVFGSRPVNAVLIRDKSAKGCDLTLVTTDCDVVIIQVIERYASRWSIEVAIQDPEQLSGAGQARNRTAAAVERTVPSEIACQAITVTLVRHRRPHQRRPARTPPELSGTPARPSRPPAT
jgi:hypothetical protein